MCNVHMYIVFVWRTHCASVVSTQFPFVTHTQCFCGQHAVSLCGTHTVPMGPKGPKGL